jgi:hypothetical protein
MGGTEPFRQLVSVAGTEIGFEVTKRHPIDEVFSHLGDVALFNTALFEVRSYGGHARGPNSTPSESCG